jgi:hypothetical protein
MTWNYPILLLAVVCFCHSTATGQQQQQQQKLKQTGEDLELELLQIVFRHGDRTPVVIYPTDFYNASEWSKYGGLGQLTQTGMQQHNEFGKFLRARYNESFLGMYYDRNRVYVRSTDYDRTIMSAQSLLSGLYPPVDYQLWSNEIKWQPVPVHTNDADKIFANPDKCARYQELKFAVIDTAEYKNLSLKYKVFV